MITLPIRKMAVRLKWQTFILFTFLAACFSILGYRILSYGYLNVDSLRWISDAVILQTASDISGLQFAIVYPPLPIYLYALISLIPGLTFVAGASIASGIVVALILAIFFRKFRGHNVPAFASLVILSLFLSHPAALQAATQGGRQAFVLLAFSIICYLLIRITQKFRVRYFVDTALALAFFFLCDAAFAVLVPILVIIFLFLIERDHFKHDYHALWVILLFPLFVVMFAFLAAGLVTADRFPKFLYAFEVSHSFREIPDHLRPALEEAGYVFINNLIAFPILLFALWRFRNESRLFRHVFFLILTPAVASFFAVSIGLPKYGFYEYMLGLSLVTSFYVIRTIPGQWLKIIPFLLLGLTTSWWKINQENPLWYQALQGKQLTNPYVEDYHVAALVGDNTSVMLDDYSGYGMLMFRGTAKNIIFPHTKEYDQFLLTGVPSAQIIVVPGDEHPDKNQDRILSLLNTRPEVYRGIYERYNVIYVSPRWEIFKRAESN